ncbi:hypothetical protein ACHAWU_000277 [Discostella pseudostelligera]|uniref:Secondary thiamine-phosphate synthase enzyme n=1 Tax=Discostella pseudostelligera TaxID=259834 RepID=A0ABD3MGA3_9STRA
MIKFYHPLLVLSVVIILPTLGRAFTFRSSHQVQVQRRRRRRYTIFSSRLFDTSTTLDNDASATTSLGMPVCAYQTITIHPSGTNDDNNGNDSAPRQAVSVEDLTPHLQSILSSSGMSNGVIHVISQHTTTAITINERESRLAQDIANYFLKICPPDERSSSEKKVPGVRYLHNDIDQRPDGEEEAQRCRTNGWDIDNPAELQKWRDQEPINAHSHLISMMLGSTECIPVVNGQMVIGQWQSVLLVDLDGPRVRSVGVQVMGYK